MRIRSLSFLAAALALAASARAGVYIETADHEAKSKKPATIHRMWVQGGLARFQDEGDYTIFQGDALVMVDPEKRTYTVLDRAAMKAVAARMDAAMAQMRARMANLPPEQRAAMERMAGGHMPGAEAKKPQIEVVDDRRNETVDGRSCHSWTVKRNGVAEEQHCVVPFSALPGHENLSDLFKRMAAFLEELRASAPSITPDVRGEFKQFELMNGFPVLTRELAKGKPTGEETRLVTWREEAVPAAQFAVPKGYKQRDIAKEMDD